LAKQLGPGLQVISKNCNQKDRRNDE